MKLQMSRCAVDMARSLISSMRAICTAALITPIPAGAQGTATAFDGTYSGVSRTLERTMAVPKSGCAPSGGAAPLTIDNGIARTLWGRPAQAEGPVSPQGVLIMRTPDGHRFDGQINGEGTVTGRFGGRPGGCTYQMVWQKKAQKTHPGVPR
jgi:hypothetical protein